MKKYESVTNRDKTLKALQMVELEGLKEIDRICRKYNIKYSLGGGTCLGQVRHGGIIPWDDDIDVDMTKENYDKFMDVALDELDTKKFFLRCRKTDKNYLRSSSRIEMVGTNLSLPRFEKKGLKVGVFVDIFEWSYLPNNKILRKIVSSNLFYLRCIENYKMYRVCAKKIKGDFRKGIVILCGKLMPYKVCLFFEKLLLNCCGKRKTNWILDDAIINGNHGGYPATGIDEYEDVLFNGIKVMNKKNCNNFLTTIYGNKCFEWLPIIQRISHHQWTNIDLGPYEKNFDLPKDYNNYISVKYTNLKHKHMQKISYEMINEVKQFCAASKIKYYLMDLSTYSYCKNVDNFSSYWLEPAKIYMLREDYDKFINTYPKKNKYFLQTNKTDDAYKYTHARLRLNYTFITDKKMPSTIREEFHGGFFIEIIPLDKSSDNVKERNKIIKKVEKMNHKIEVKWLDSHLVNLHKAPLKDKILWFELLSISQNKLIKKYDKYIKKLNDRKSEYYFNSAASSKSMVFKYSTLGKGKDVKINNLNVRIPTKTNEYIEEFEDKFKDNLYINYIKNMSKKKENNIKNIESVIEKEDVNLTKLYSACNLTYYDMDEYQLTVLRYDEKKDKLLSNKEIIGE